MKTRICLLSLSLLGLSGCQLTSTSDAERRDNYAPLNQVLVFGNHAVSSDYVRLNASLVNHRSKKIQLHLETPDGNITALETYDGNHLRLPILAPEQAQQSQLICINCTDDIYVLLTLDFKAVPQELGYDELFIALQDQNKLAEILGHGRTWLTPPFDRLWIFFDEPATTRMMDRSGHTIDESYGHEQRIKVDEHLHNQDVRITFSHPVKNILMLN